MASLGDVLIPEHPIRQEQLFQTTDNPVKISQFGGFGPLSPFVILVLLFVYTLFSNLIIGDVAIFVSCRI